MPGAAVCREGQHCHPRRFASDRLPVSALAIAISASCAAVGCGTTLQSANPSGWPAYCGSIRNSEESVLHPGCRPIRRRPARSTLAVDERFPAIHTSACPALTIAAANISGSASLSTASAALYRRRAPAGGGKRLAHRRLLCGSMTCTPVSGRRSPRANCRSAKGLATRIGCAGPAAADNAPPSTRGRPAHPGTPPWRGAQRQFATLVNDHLHLPAAAVG